MHVWVVVYTFIFHFQVAAVMLALLQIVIRSFSSLLDSIILQSQELVGIFVDTWNERSTSTMHSIVSEVKE